jgi:hypothetical protein
VIGLCAAGITSGLAALGPGLGMVPGIGVAVLIGIGAFLGVRALLGTSQGTQGQLQRDLARRAQAVITSLEEMITLLDLQADKLARAADTQTDSSLPPSASAGAPCSRSRRAAGRWPRV